MRKQFGSFVEDRWAFRLAVELTNAFSFVNCEVGPDLRPFSEREYRDRGARSSCFVAGPVTKDEKRQVEAFVRGFLRAHRFAASICSSQQESQVV